MHSLGRVKETGVDIQGVQQCRVGSPVTIQYRFRRPLIPANLGTPLSPGNRPPLGNPILRFRGPNVGPPVDTAKNTRHVDLQLVLYILYSHYMSRSMKMGQHGSTIQAVPSYLFVLT